MSPAIRKHVIQLETVHHDGGPAPASPVLKGVCAAVIANPYAGSFEPNLLPWMESLRPLAEDLAARLLAALGVPAERVRAFGKGAVVGVDGELEHAAVWHAPGGHGLKSLLKARGF